MNTAAEAGVEVVHAETKGPTGVLGRLVTGRLSLADWAIHASGRFDRADTAWVDAFRWYVHRCIWLTGTEAAGRSPADFKRGLAGVRGTWASAHLTGPAAGECWAAWDTRGVTLEHAEAVKITDMTWTRSPEYGGQVAAKVHALVVRLVRTRGRKSRRVIFVVVHMPLDNTQQRAATWVDCCTGPHGLVLLVQSLEAEFPDAEVVVVGDFNKDLRNSLDAARVHQRLLDPLHRVTCWDTQGLPAKGGTLVGARKVIDYSIIRRGVVTACQVLRVTKASDHIAIRYRLGGWLGRLTAGRHAA